MAVNFRAQLRRLALALGLVAGVGFAANGVQVALGTGSGFNPSTQWVAGFGSAAGYTTTSPRQLADFDGDGFPDIVGSLGSGTSVARTARTNPPDWIASLANGVGATTTLTYGSLSSSANLYLKGAGATYPQADITAPLYVVATAKLPNALGSGYLTNSYKYGGLRVDMSGRGLLGFGWMEATQTDTGISTRTDFRQDWPYTGFPLQMTKLLPGYGNNGILGWTSNSYACVNPQTGSACAVVAGNRYFPYVSQSTEFGWDGNGASLPTTQTTNTFDSYGNATQITVSTSDGFNKTTTNTYTNDTTNWLLGRLTRSQVASDATGTSVPNMPGSTFVFNQTISADTLNYNLRSAAIAAGWNGVMLLEATVTINAGVYVGSSTTNNYAFDTGATFPTGSSLKLVNNGFIVGAGGAGGAGGGSSVGRRIGSAGGDGGTAVRAQAAVTITNKGTIGGGGGGGGGSGIDCEWSDYVIGGGGGQGYTGGAGGIGYHYEIPPRYGMGTAGTKAAAGLSGGESSLPYGKGGMLGNAGFAGQSYEIGCDAEFDPYGFAGGAAGAAAIGNANIIWISTGTRLGALQ